MKVILITVFVTILGLGSHGQFDPQIRKLGNLILALATHLFARFTDSEMPSGYQNGTLIEQMNYIHTMLHRMKDLFLNPPEHLRSQFRDLTQTFILQVQPQIPCLDIDDKELKEKFGLSESDIESYHSMAKESKTFVEEIIKTRGEEVTEKYL